MNRMWIVFFLLIAALIIVQAETPKTALPAATATPDAPQLSPLAQQLVDYEKALPEAQKKKDLAFYKRTLTDDFVAVGTDAKIHPRAEILGDLPSIELIEYRPYNIDVVQLNDGAAVVTYDVIIRMAKYDEDTPRYQHISSIWVKQGDQWKLKFQQATAAQ
jgi:hypothetical protein